MTSSLRIAAVALAGAAFVAPAAVRAQSSTAVVQAPNSVELGIDAGATLGLGKQSSVDIFLPAQRARIGFFLNNDSRVSIEPAASFTYGKTKGTSGISNYNAELGALYHFRPNRLVSEVTPASRSSVAYVRPFVGFTGRSVGGNTKNDNEGYMGAGLGLKVPFRTNIAFRFESNLGYGFSNRAARLGLNAGLSFFTRRGA